MAVFIVLVTDNIDSLTLLPYYPKRYLLSIHQSDPPLLENKYEHFATSEFEGSFRLG